jgi:hypothetical protein
MRLDRWCRIEEGHVERLSVGERERIAQLVAEGAPFWRLRQEVPRSRYAIHRAVRRLLRAPAPEPTRSALRLSLAEREEISRGLALTLSGEMQMFERLSWATGELASQRPVRTPATQDCLEWRFTASFCGFSGRAT